MTNEPPAQRRLARAWQRLKRLLLVGALLVAALVALYFVLALNFAYASGERKGYVQRFSKRGWICKTWEGEIAVVSMPGTLPELLAFSVRDDAVAAEINKHLGAPVTLHYEQHPGLPSCFGETAYLVTGVQPVVN